MIWTGGAGLTLPGQNAMQKDPFFFCGWAEDSESGKYAVSPYIPKKNITLYAIWRDIGAITAESEAKAANCPRVIGNPANNSSAALEISNVASALTELMQGTDATRWVNTDGTDTLEHYTVYDYSAIYQTSAVLESMAAELSSGEIIVESMYFNYIAPAAANQNPVQQATLRTAGVYEIELAGAAGGHMWTISNKTGTGGKGGHVLGEYTVPADTDIDVRVGGQGQGTAHYNANESKYTPIHTSNGTTIDYSVTVDGRKAKDNQAGGYNGGGKGGSSANIDATNYTAGSGGGGATDIQLHSEARNLTGLPGDPRIAVAGGGGGAAQKNGSGNPALPGGNSGGLTGGDGGATVNVPKGATQTNGGTQLNAKCTAGVPGQGADGANGVATPQNAEGRGGGGAGWWGGGALTTGADTQLASGAGGSSYASGSGSITLVSGTEINETMPGNVWGDGWAKITWKR